MAERKVGAPEAKPLLPAGTYWCAVASHHDGSSVLGVYGPYRDRDAADQASDRLKDAGIHVHESWTIQRLHMIDFGPEAAADA